MEASCANKRGPRIQASLHPEAIRQAKQSNATILAGDVAGHRRGRARRVWIGAVDAVVTLSPTCACLEAALFVTIPRIVEHRGYAGVPTVPVTKLILEDLSSLADRCQSYGL